MTMKNKQGHESTEIFIIHIIHLSDFHRRPAPMKVCLHLLIICFDTILVNSLLIAKTFNLVLEDPIYTDRGWSSLETPKN